MELLEWMYEHSHHAPYKEKLLALSKRYQRVRPTRSWAYSFEAKWAHDEKDQLRALSYATYLDSKGKRIADILQHKKDRAREWIQENPLF